MNIFLLNSANLIIFYAGLLLVNIVIAFTMWIVDKNKLYFSLFLVWMATFLSFLMQGILSKTLFFATIGFSFCFLISLALCKLFSDMTPIKIPWKYFIYGQCMGILMCLFIQVIGGPFSLMALPVSLSIAAPLLFLILKAPKKEPTIVNRGLLVTYFIFVVHVMDFPFLRDNPAFVGIGFTLACLIILSISMGSFGAVIESVTKEKLKALNANQHKTRFLAQLCHDIRSSLHTMIGFSDYLKNHPKEDVGKVATLIRNPSNLHLKSVDDLIDIVRIKKGDIPVHHELFCLQNLLKEISATMTLSLAQKTDVTFKRNTSNIPPPLTTDSRLLKRILMNLLSNAVKFTKKGSIGLSIVQKFVHALKGSLVVESVPGKWTCFRGGIAVVCTYIS
ncbi:MAG: HAMP domain-containing histidine kinase [Candidatus Margulisbacteria bacterium]|nr:HAMP domain-containing histidine kinase [Candidatus Margulisiibacteriota bacterium]